MKILDIDDISSWEETYNGFIRNDPHWNAIQNALSQESDDQFIEIITGLEYRIECVESSELLSLRERCTEHFKKTYTHVGAYHGCRPANIESYLLKGILPANPEKDIERAKMFFGDADAVTRVMKDIPMSYLDHGRGKIGFSISRTGSIDTLYSHYLEYGSELFQAIANRLGEWARQKLSEHGVPTLFRCAIPVSWLDEFAGSTTAAFYAKQPLLQLLIRRRWPESCDDPIKGAFLLAHSLPKELIVDAIDMTQSLSFQRTI